MAKVSATTRNIQLYKGLPEGVHKGILEDRFMDYKKEFFANYQKDDSSDDTGGEDQSSPL